MSDDPGVELAHYRLHHGCGVRFTCTACKAHRDFPLEDVIARLAKRGLGSERTGINAVAAFVEKACQRCGGLRFTTTPAWGVFKAGKP